MKFKTESSIESLNEQDDENKKEIEIQKRDEKKEGQLKNSFFRKKQLEYAKNKCRFCKGKNHLQIHHEAYNPFCPYFEKNMKPNCKECHDSDFLNFLKCTSCCIVLCFGCHIKRHKMFKKVVGNWTGGAKASPLPKKDECSFCNHKVKEEMVYCPNCQRKICFTKEDLKKLDDIHNKWAEIRKTELEKTSKKLTGNLIKDEKIIDETLKEIDKLFFDYLKNIP